MSLTLMAGSGDVQMQHNWIKTGWQNCHCTPSGSVNDLGNNLTGTLPGFTDLSGQNWLPNNSSDLINSGMMPLNVLLPEHHVDKQYSKHQGIEHRPESGAMDIGAFELCDELACDLIFTDGFD